MLDAKGGDAQMITWLAAVLEFFGNIVLMSEAQQW